MAAFREDLLIARDTLTLIIDFKFRISRSTSRLLEYDAEPSKREGGEDKTPFKRDSREVLGICLRANRMIGWLSFIALAVLPAPLQYRVLQHHQIQGLVYRRKLSLSTEDLLWWTQKLSLYNGKCLIFPQVALVVSSEASTQGLGSIMSWANNRRVLVSEGEEISHKYVGIKSS